MILQDYSFNVGEDLTLFYSGAAAIGGGTYRFQMMKRFQGGSGLIDCYSASGYNGVSGFTITNSGGGLASIGIQSPWTSGLDPGSYAYDIQQINSGSRQVLQEGYCLLYPDTGI